MSAALLLAEEGAKLIIAAGSKLAYGDSDNLGSTAVSVNDTKTGIIYARDNRARAVALSKLKANPAYAQLQSKGLLSQSANGFIANDQAMKGRQASLIQKRSPHAWRVLNRSSLRLQHTDTQTPGTLSMKPNPQQTLQLNALLAKQRIILNEPEQTVVPIGPSIIEAALQSVPRRRMDARSALSVRSRSADPARPAPSPRRKPQALSL